MDPSTINTAITTALVAAGSSGITDVGKRAILDAYEAVKARLKNKFGHSSAVIQALEKVEDAPDSLSRQENLSREIVAQNAHQDPEFLAAVQTLLDELKMQAASEQHVQGAKGTGIAQADHGSSASVNISGWGPKSHV